MASIKEFVNLTVPTELRLELSTGQDIEVEFMGTRRAVGVNVDDDAGDLLLRVKEEDGTYSPKEVDVKLVTAFEVTGDGPLR